jgi:hypothetical protein
MGGQLRFPQGKLFANIGLKVKKELMIRFRGASIFHMAGRTCLDS